eukprot:14454011-Alexandrium_andersonii.AAC.1
MCIRDSLPHPSSAGCEKWSPSNVSTVSCQARGHGQGFQDALSCGVVSAGEGCSTILAGQEAAKGRWRLLPVQGGSDPLTS